MFQKITAGSTSRAIPLRIRDTLGDYYPSLVYNTDDLACRYRREGQSSWTTITLATATLGTWTSGGFVTSGGPTGGYEFGVPNAVLAAGAKWAEIEFDGADGMEPLSVFIELDTVNYQPSDGFIPANVKAIDDSTTAAARMRQFFGATRLITVDDATFSPTTTEFETDQTVDDAARYAEQVLYALNGANVGYTARITSYAFANSKVKLTVDTLPAAPADGHEFILLGRIEQ